MNNQIKTALFAGVASVALFANTAFAQETSASLRGSIATEQGSVVTGAKIKVTHVPSGSSRTFTSTDNGSFSGRGLRVGGPYKITVTSSRGEATYENIFLRLGEPFNLNAIIGATALEEIVVTGKKSAAFDKSGPGSFFGQDDIDGAQGVDRDLKDILRRSPLINIMSNDSAEMSVAGINPKYNSLTVDGVRQNDDFGLQGAGYPTQRSPISLDAISQMSVAIAPYSASTGGFTGANVNVVTKSGTNEFHGSAFYEFRSDKLAGNKSKDDDISDISFKKKFYGATLGGPIIKDKLFFFLAYEHYEAPQTFDYGPMGSGSANETVASQEQVNQVISIAQSVYGVDAGDWNNPVDLKNEQIMAKLDWNINDDHRASFTYQFNDGNKTRNMTSNVSELRLSSHWYNSADKMKIGVGQLYSDWSDNFSTEVKVGYKALRNTQASLAAPGVGDVTIDIPGGRIALGSDQYRHANRLSNNTLTAMVKGIYTTGDHEITGGWEYDSLDIFNIFAPNSLGTWAFDSIADFENRQASRFDYSNAYSNISDDAAAQFKFKYNTFYIEDKWAATDALTITAGLRYETVSTDDAPSANSLFAQRYGFSNTSTLDGKNILLPRLGFSWTASDRLTLRGGVGKFSGGKPNVWISNAFTNDGVTIVGANSNNYDSAAVLANADISSVPTAVKDSMAPGNGLVNPIDPNFKLPADWKWSLAADYTADLGPLGDDWLISVEALFSKTVNGQRWVDLARIPMGTDSTGRPIYVPFDPLDSHVPTNSFDDNGYDRYDLMLTNGGKGNSQVFAIDLSKEFDNGIKFSIGYAHQNVNNSVSGTSSTAKSNYQYDPHIDRQNPEVGTAAYEVKHRITWSLAWEKELISDHKTRISLFGDHHSGRPFSWTLGSYKDYGFGDQYDLSRSAYYLPYIPTSANDGVTFPSWFTFDDFTAIIEEAGLSEYAGGYVPKNSQTAPFVHRVDLKISQEIPSFFEGQKAVVYFDMKNLLNFIDSDWGREEGLPFGSNQQTLVDWSMNSDGEISYSAPFGGLNANGPRDFRALASVWQIKLGVRYKF